MPFDKTKTILAIAAVLVLAACRPDSSTGAVSTSVIVSTPAQDRYMQAFSGYVARLEQDGLVTEKAIDVQGSDPFIFIMRPDNEAITDEEIQAVTELVLRTVSVFESRGGLRQDDIDITFKRPARQRILLIKDQDMPDLLDQGEATVSVDSSYFTSIVNLAGPQKSGSQDFANDWSVIQAICIAYGGNFQDVDPVCNIISSNAAAGWVGMEREQAAKLIDSYGTTDLGYLGGRDFRYRFIDFVFDEFVR